VIVFKDPLTPEEHLNLGIAYERRGELDAAAAQYELASKELPSAYLYLGNAHFKKNEPDRAEKYYRKAIEEDPENADALNNLAWLYYTVGRNLEEAEALVLRALELNPSKSDIYKDTLLKIRSLRRPALPIVRP
jgi:tetratricopeptide (TPR) repeat protein